MKRFIIDLSYSVLFILAVCSLCIYTDMIAEKVNPRRNEECHTLECYQDIQIQYAVGVSGKEVLYNVNN